MDQTTCPLKRIGPRGSGKFEAISCNEAMETAREWLGDIGRENPAGLAFLTGHTRSQSLNGWWAQQFGTPIYAAHGRLCPVNIAAAGLHTRGGACREFAHPDRNRTKPLRLFGVAEDQDSNPLKARIDRLGTRGATVVTVDPVRTGCNAVADEWMGITPGTGVHRPGGFRFKPPCPAPRLLAGWPGDNSEEGRGAPEIVRDPPIRELAHDAEDDLSRANADAVTGRTASDDLRMRIEKAEAPADGRGHPCADAQTWPVAPAPRRPRSPWVGVR